MGLLEWGGKRFARGIARAMIRSYKAYKEAYPALSEYELVKKTLSARPGKSARTLLSDIENEEAFNKLGGDLFNITFVLVLMEHIEDGGGNLEDQEELSPIFKSTILEETEKMLK
jgi:hypothetical protein